MLWTVLHQLIAIAKHYLETHTREELYELERLESHLWDHWLEQGGSGKVLHLVLPVKGEFKCESTFPATTHSTIPDSYIMSMALLASSSAGLCFLRMPLAKLFFNFRKMKMKTFHECE